MKKILLAVILTLSSISGTTALTAYAEKNTVNTYGTTTMATKGDKAVALEGTAEVTMTAGSEAAQPIEQNTRLTPEQRNKKIKDADGTGIGITLMSMAIVIAALIILSILFLAFGKISQRMLTNKKIKTYGIIHDDDNHEASSGEAIAAIAAALHQHFNARHDIEDTVLTIRKLKRAYSPWSSKLYGLRQVPERNSWHR